MAGVVVVFDFDHTIINCDSDNLVVDGLGATDLFNELSPTMPWNPLMDRMMKELHSQGKTIEDIVEVLKTTPIHPRIVAAIREAHALGCDLRIVSDANVFFIETILKHLGLEECFTEINTNPSHVDEQGRLRISPFCDFTSSPHGCSLCPPNMCKSVITERIRSQASAEGRKRMIYVGDGVGDYCPSLNLREGDFVIPRKNFPLFNKICQNPLALKAEIHEWIDGEEFEHILLNLINRITIEESAAAQFITTDCKLETIYVSGHESFAKALPV
ncbi:inorganic pyrophosphatase 1-like [Argentina anserina]|uniref:inorganic pyrophosphatase 1-like n=1 Tax=Argentina anserina TaxID=57926 RepID=UPI0021766676|nr:inorganic pyrophosphatase 1-like [Potentilla anserina]